MYRRSQDTHIEPAGHCGELVQSVTIFNGQETGDTRKVFWGEPTVALNLLSNCLTDSPDSSLKGKQTILNSINAYNCNYPRIAKKQH